MIRCLEKIKAPTELLILTGNWYFCFTILNAKHFNVRLAKFNANRRTGSITGGQAPVRRAFSTFGALHQAPQVQKACKPHSFGNGFAVDRRYSNFH
jgi:hypothetical protein